MPKKRSVRRPAIGSAREHTLHGLELQRALPEPSQLAGGPRKHDDDAAVRLQHEAGRRSGEPDRDRPLRTCRLLANTGRELGIRPAESLRDHLRYSLDLTLELVVDDERATRHARDELDRPVVVRRPEPA